MTETATILALWEAGQGPVRGRATRILVAAGDADAARLTLGEATRRVLALRARLLGDTLVSLAACPACGEMNEAALATEALAEVPVDPGPLRVEAEGWCVTARHLTLADFDDAAAAPDPESAAALLRDRAIVLAEGPDGADAPIPDSVVAAVERALDEADALADASLALTCAACGVAWEVAFDAAAFLAEELGATVRRRLAEVATLARAFGWSEAEILAIPPARRRVYLELAG